MRPSVVIYLVAVWLGFCPPALTKLMSTRQPLVSACVITRNRASFVTAAIESALAQRSATFDLEVIVVDDGSSDETPDLLKRLPVRVVTLTGEGLPSARNAAIQAAGGDYITMIDDDDVWLPGALQSMVDALEQNPRYAAVHGRAQLTRMDLTPYGDPYPPWPLTSGFLLRELLEFFPQHATIMTRMDVVRREGGLDTSFAWADWDWVLRIAARHEILRIETTVLLFRQRDIAEEEGFKRRADWVVPTFRRHMPSLGGIQAIKLQRQLWRHRGWMTDTYMRFAHINWVNGERRRAAKATSYAFRTSFPHTCLSLLRSWPFRSARRPETRQQLT